MIPAANLLIEKLRNVEARYEELNQLLAEPEVVLDSKRYLKTAKAHSDIGEIVSKFREYKDLERGISETGAMGREETDPELKAMAEEELANLEQRRVQCETDLKLLLLPTDPNDERNVILEIRAGTGGDEATLFAADVFRMYSRYAESRRWRVEILSSNPTGVGGFKEIIASISGKGVFARLKYESGVHRVQRVPATEASGRIHTSAATVAVLPEVEDIDLDIRPEDIRIDTMRAGGAGGQHVNKTDSAVRITHLPTGLIVVSAEKSQHQNRRLAMQVLRSRLYEQQRQKAADSRAAQRKGQIGSGDRSQRIRTYNFPQGRVTDHRINLTLYKIDQIVDGDLFELTQALAQEFQAEQLAALGETS